MAEVVRNEPPVLIENISLVINVFNVGQHGDLNNFSIGGAQQPLGLLPQNGLIQASTSSTRSTDASCSLQKSLNEPEQNAKFPLGWIAFLNGDVIPFGVQPTALEIPSFGDRKSWKEIRVCLPLSLLALDNETDLYCPVSSCREKLPKNKSIDCHIRKHLGFTDKETQSPALPCPIFYYCQDRKCQYYVEAAEKSFKAYKNVKQHYKKVHAPRLFECEQCQQTFCTQKVLETHKLMCGEKYSCSTCDLSYKTLESLQTHCRRKNHIYDHNKYKDKRNSVKQEMQSLKGNVPPATPSVVTTVTGRKAKSGRQSRLLTLLPKRSEPTSQVFDTIQAFCQRAGVKVDLGCQTVCTTFIQKSNPMEAVVPPATPSFTQKKRKSTDTQTNIFKFRATCLDQKHNATNTNLDWKKVIMSDSQTQTSDSCDTIDLAAIKAATDSSIHFNDEFATFKISETSSEATAPPLGTSFNAIPNDHNSNVKLESLPCVIKTTDVGKVSEKETTNSNKRKSSATPASVFSGPSVTEEFISFLEAIDSSTQTDPEMFDAFGSGECFGIRGLFEGELTGTKDAHYVSVSSTASQTAVERVSTKSLSAEDYEVLLNTTDNTKLKDIDAFSDYIKNVDGTSGLNHCESTVDGGVTTTQQQQLGNEFHYDWEHIVEEVYWGNY